jgi:rhodanese-related sulfurtransferase
MQAKGEVILFAILTGIALVFTLYVIRNFILPYAYLKPIEQTHVNSNDYCTIDIRDYSTFHNTPIEEAINIPLSVLHRSVEKEDCDKNIVVVSDDTKGALMAARILKKAKKKPVFYYTV